MHCIAGAHDRDRTGDLVLTKDVLYQLSYVSVRRAEPAKTDTSNIQHEPQPRSDLERVAGIEPAPSAWKAEVLPLNYTRSASRPVPVEAYASHSPDMVEGVGF